MSTNYPQTREIRIKLLHRRGWKPAVIAATVGCSVGEVCRVLTLQHDRPLIFPNNPPSNSSYQGDIDKQIGWHLNRVKALRMMSGGGGHE